MGGFSKVTHFLRDTLLTGDQVSASSNNELMRSAASSALDTGSLTAPTSLAVNSLSEAGFELVTAVSQVIM